jgi:tetratricopeptide (TPR) repeat protein
MRCSVGVTFWEANIRIYLRSIIFFIAFFMAFAAAQTTFAQDANLVFSKAKSAYDNREYEKAIKLFEMGFENDSENALSYYYYGMCLRARPAPYADVLSAFRKSVALGGSSQVAADAMEKIAEIQLEEEAATAQAKLEKEQEVEYHKRALEEAVKEQEVELISKSIRSLADSVTNKCFCKIYTYEYLDKKHKTSTCLMTTSIDFKTQDLIDSKEIIGQMKAQVRAERFVEDRKTRRVSFEYVDNDLKISSTPKLVFSLQDLFRVTNVDGHSWDKDFIGDITNGLNSVDSAWGDIADRFEIEDGKISVLNPDTNISEGLELREFSTACPPSSQ